ncbi:MAG: UDP-3-O-acyl-N-acetylglucosamine deacetylase [Planctomycetaceae bacterium]
MRRVRTTDDLAIQRSRGSLPGHADQAVAFAGDLPALNRPTIDKESYTVIRPRNEHTIAAECEVSGRGYWSGASVRLRFRPGAVGSGIRFVRTDLAGMPSCIASTQTSCGQSMRTNLTAGRATFQMVEHVMAALYALEIDNCIVESDAEEMPGLDGSSGPLVEAFLSVGLVKQAAARNRYIVDRVMRIGDATSWIEVSPSDHGCASFEYRLDYGDSSPIQAQTYKHWLTPKGFCKELASARTFVTADQAAQLRERGIGTHVTNDDLIVFDHDGCVLGNRLRYANECARHKTLDLIGDLALAGTDLLGNFVSYRGGHQLNGQMARLLAQFATGSQMSAGTGSQSAPPIVQRACAA